MLATAHLVAGAALAVSIRDPLFVAPIAFFGHLALDAVPHWNYPLVSKWSWKGIVSIAPEIVGMAIGYGLFLLAFPRLWFVITLGAFFAIAPDLLSEARIFLHKNALASFQAFHEHVQWEVTPVFGLIVQIIFCGLILVWLFGW